MSTWRPPRLIERALVVVMCALLPVIAMAATPLDLGDTMDEARLLYDAGHHRDALDVLLRMKADPAAMQHIKYRHALGRCYEHLSMWAEARDEYRAVVEMAADPVAEEKGRRGLERVQARLPGGLVIECSVDARVSSTPGGPFHPCPLRLDDLPPGVTVVHVRQGDIQRQVIVDVQAGAVRRHLIPDDGSRHPDVDRAMDPDADRAMWVAGIGVGLSRVLGSSTRWRFDPGLSYAAGVGYRQSVLSWLALGVDAGYQRQMFTFTAVSGGRYDVAVDSLTAVAGLRLDGRAVIPMDLELFVGSGADFILRGEALRVDDASPDTPQHISLRAVQGLAVVGLGWWLRRSTSWSWQLEVVGSMGLTPAGAGEARFARTLVVSGFTL